MTDEDRLMAALEYQRAMRAALGNQNLMRQGRRMNLPARQAPGALSEFVNQGVSLDPQPDQGYGTMAAEMGLSFIPGVGQAMAARDLERGRRANDPLGMALAGLSFVPFGKLIGALRGGKQIGPVSELDVYHGSPHKFDKFDSSKIGTGEGAQAYGHGLYFADSPGVAKSYRDKLSDGFTFPGGTKLDSSSLTDMGFKTPQVKAIISSLNLHQGDVAKASQTIRGNASYLRYGSAEQNSLQKAADFVSGIKANELPSSGSLYKVDLPDEQIAKMLDWDKPLSQQHPDVQKALKALHGKDALGRSLDKAKPMSETDIGQWLYMNIQEGRNQRLASEALQKQGIPGIRYLDGSSRGAGQGTSNYVVFPGGESMLNILERNGSRQDVRNMMRQTVPDSSLMYKDPFGEID